MHDLQVIKEAKPVTLNDKNVIVSKPETVIMYMANRFRNCIVDSGTEITVNRQFYQ